PFRRAFRRAPGRVAFAALAAPARAHLARGRCRRGKRDRGRALGAVSALCRSRADRRRRGARPRLQAGGRRTLPRPRHGGVVRARGADIPIVLVSATPSVETEVNARRGRYARVHLPERFGSQHLPAIEAIDLRAEGPPRGRFIAPRLAAAVTTALERGEQAL